jgi:hypothetical protein
MPVQFADDRRRKVLFLIHSPETFSALEPLVDLLAARPSDFELLLVAVPRNYSGEGATSFEDLEANYAYLKAKDLRTIALRGDSFEDLRALIHLQPDFIFRQSPWDIDIPPLFASHLLAFAKLCYVPYGLMTVEMPEYQYNQPFHNICDLIFCESDFHHQEYAKHRARKTDGVYVTGYPRFERLLAALRSADPGRSWPITSAGGAPKVIWAPHHAINKNWLGFSTFLDYKDLMLREARGRRVSILFRPHPALLPRLMTSGAMTESEYCRYLEDFEDAGISQVDKNKDYAHSFAASDALITDGVGFFSEYLLTGKPLIRTMRKDSAQLNRFGQWMVESCRDVVDAVELQTVLDELAGHRYVDSQRELRLQRQQTLQRLSEGAAARVLQHLEAVV